MHEQNPVIWAVSQKCLESHAVGPGDRRRDHRHHGARPSVDQEQVQLVVDVPFHVVRRSVYTGWELDAEPSRRHVMDPRQLLRILCALAPLRRRCPS